MESLREETQNSIRMLRKSINGNENKEVMVKTEASDDGSNPGRQNFVSTPPVPPKEAMLQTVQTLKTTGV
jgi:hypothetical protein